MAVRLYLMQQPAPVAVDPDGGLTLPGIALAHAVNWRGWGAYNNDGSLADPTPALPTRVRMMPIRGGWWLLAVNATDWTWFDANGRRLPDPPLDRALTAPERNGLNTFLGNRGIDMTFTNGDVVRDVVRRLVRLNPDVRLAAFAADAAFLGSVS